MAAAVENSGSIATLETESLSQYKAILDCSHVVAEGKICQPGFKCEVKIELRKLRCDHKMEVPCHEVEENGGALEFRFLNRYCREVCGERLPCGDVCRRTCHMKLDPHGLRHRTLPTLVCMKDCKRHCARGHQCPGYCGIPCSPVCSKCEEMSKNGLLEDKCDKILRGCEHRCLLSRHDGSACPPCQVPVATYRKQCEHRSWVECCTLQQFPRNCHVLSKLTSNRRSPSPWDWDLRLKLLF